MNAFSIKPKSMRKGLKLTLDQAIERYNTHCSLLGIGSSAINRKKSSVEKNRVKLCNALGNVVCTISGNPEFPLIKLFKA